MLTTSSQFINQYYPSLILGPALFYSWNIGVRFDLQSEVSTSDQAYFTEVVRRATSVFEAVFKPTDEVLIVVQRPRDKRYFRRRRFRANDLLFRLLNASKQEAHFQRLANRTRFASTQQLIRFTIQRSANQIPYQQILQAISYQDFSSRTPQLHDDIFFLNLRSKLILHMYDDRGLDVISSNADTLRPLYNSHHHLLLDYDRQQMLATFS
ncbi:DUF3885 domain-containing protein [Hymenobacter norwichensis]|uniref:DUF3885 domain-containing protein n=1 Tax=Hymenobacter norwichensis TaxID=223903 RepID=UPI0003B7AB64